MGIIVCMNVMFLCLWDAARGTEVLSEGVTQSRDDCVVARENGEK